MPQTESIGRRRVALAAAFGVLALALMGAFLFRATAARSPEQVQQRVKNLAKDLVRERWEEMRRAVEQVGSDEGARTLYRANPGLAPRVPDEAAFLRLSRSWRRLLQPVPEAIPDPASRDLGYERTPAGAVLSYREANGTRVWMRWSPEGQLTEMRVY